MDVQMHNDIQILSRGVYLQFLVEIKLLDDAIIRSNEPEEVLTHTYEALGERFILPWRKTKGKIRRIVLERQRAAGIDTDCYLKDNLCMECPACLLFGGTGEVSKKKCDYNLLSRVMGDTFVSTENVGHLEPYTANAVDEKTLQTGQALMTLLKVPSETTFKGVVTLRDPTPETTAILADSLNSLSRLGASTREWGRVETNILGYVLADREKLSSYNVAQTTPEVNTLEGLSLPNVKEAYSTVREKFLQLLENENLLKSKK